MILGQLWRGSLLGKNAQKNDMNRTSEATNSIIPIIPLINTLATGYGDFRTSVAKRRRRATEISVFPYGWMEEEFDFVMC